MVLDVRVRRALSFSLDRAALNDGLFEGEVTLADSFVPPTVEYFPIVDREIVKYPYDAAKAEKLMSDAGYAKGGDGAYVHPREGRFAGEIRVNATAQAETEVGILAESWRRAGFDFRETPIPPAQSRLGEVRSAFPTLYVGAGAAGEGALASFASAQIASAENRWVGINRGGWSSPDYDRLFQVYSRTLDRTQRSAQMLEMAKQLTSSVAAISLYFSPAINR
jgi:peptide/nickel transport system substrate-binding protein